MHQTGTLGVINGIVHQSIKGLGLYLVNGSRPWIFLWPPHAATLIPCQPSSGETPNDAWALTGSSPALSCRVC